MPDHKNIHEALLAASAEFPAVERDTAGQVGTRPYRYAGLPGVLEKVLPVLRAHGILLTQTPEVDGEAMGLVTTLRHVPTETEIVGTTPLPIPGNWQDWGSAVTYARRYSLLPMLGLAPEDDDDGARAQGVGPRRAASRPAAAPQARTPLAQARIEGMEAVKAIEQNPGAQHAWVVSHFPELADKSASEYTLAEWGDIIDLAREYAGEAWRGETS